MKKRIIILVVSLVLLILLSPFLFIRIKIIGEKEFYLNYGDKYSEPGFKATIFGKNISDQVVVENKIQNDLGNYAVTYSYKFLFYNIKRERKIIVDDIKGPNIELVGGELYDTTVGEEFVEPGFKAIDNLDGDISKTVSITGQVNTTTLGKYTLEYEAIDSHGNKSKVQRIVNVVKKNPTQMSIEEYTLEGWYDETKLAKTEAKGNDYFNSLVMVGDSNTMNMYLLGHLQSKNAWAIPCLHSYDMLNKPINLYGYGIQKTLYEAIDTYKPEKMIINFGSFSTVWLSEEVFIESANRVIETIKAKNLDIDIAIISLYPITKSGPNINEFNQNVINRSNFLLLELANKHGVKFLDVQEVLKDQTGYGNPSLYEYDGFHLNTYGQNKVKEYIKEHAMGG